MISVTLVICSLFLTLLLALVRCVGTGRNSKLPLPPGPAGLPLIGNLHQLPRRGIQFKLFKWSQQYGKIYSLQTGLKTMVVLTDRTLVRQLLDDRSAIYSDRPDSYVYNELISPGDHLLAMKYGPQWRAQRKIITQEYGESACNSRHVHLQEAEANQMLRDFLEEPENFWWHPRRFAMSLIMSTVFGIRMKTAKAKYIPQFYDLADRYLSIGEPGACPPVDLIPILKYLPDCLWDGWKSRAKILRNDMENLYGGLVQRIEKRRISFGSRGSLVDKMLDSYESLGIAYHEIISICGRLLEGGADSSALTLLVFLQAMVVSPDAQHKAQQEIDAVIGSSRSPTWDDYEKLPYISQIVKETIRWKPLGGMGFPHATLREDVIDGMRIPKGSTIIMNVMGLHWDPKRYPEPEEFRPENFDGLTAPASELYKSKTPETGRDHYYYGIGRRICPGIHFAERNLFLAISKLLWAFEFGPATEIDGHGVERKIPIDVNLATGYTSGFVLQPKPFKMHIRVRSEDKRQTILREFERAQNDHFSKYEEEG